LDINETVEGTVTAKAKGAALRTSASGDAVARACSSTAT
jgi:hypothetical protein